MLLQRRFCQCLEEEFWWFCISIRCQSFLSKLSASLLCQKHLRTVALLTPVSMLAAQMPSPVDHAHRFLFSVVSIWTTDQTTAIVSVSFSAWLFIIQCHSIPMPPQQQRYSPAFLFPQLNESMSIPYSVATTASIKQDQSQQCCRKMILLLSDNC